MNKFKIICTSYNNETWAPTCVDSVLNQTYKNFEFFYFNDGSTDKTYEYVLELTKNDRRCRVINLEENKTKSWIFSNLLDKLIDDNDIVVFLDGDDWLATYDVLNLVNGLYERESPWVAYGGMLCWDGEKTEEPFPQNSDYSPEVINNRDFRRDAWRSSHLKTMRGFVWKSIDKSHFVSALDGKYILGPDDLVIMFDAMEMCPPGKVSKFSDHTYIYNSCQENAARIKQHQTERGVNYEKEIRNRPKCKILPYITAALSGGLGNQMFQIAATISTAKRLGYIPLFDMDNHFLPLQGQKVSYYKDNVFRKLSFVKSIPLSSKFEQNGFHFEEINVNPYTLLCGGFQSERFFDPILVRNTFSCSDNIKSIINEKYGELLSKGVSSVHVRRGDYLKLAPYHVICPKEYYYQAMEKIGAGHYLIFSDDLDWCKETFNGDQFTFIREMDYIELYIMSKCKHNIISNSTFGWWGAWLNENTDKIVIAPTPWFGTGYSHWNLSDLIPKKWNCVNYTPNLNII